MDAWLQGLGGAALLGLNVVLWTWGAGVLREFWRERRDAGLLPVVTELTRANRQKDDVIRAQNAELDGLHQEAARLKAHMEKCGVGGGTCRP